MIISRLLDTDKNTAGPFQQEARQSENSLPDVILEVKAESHRLALGHWHEVKDGKILPARADLNLSHLRPILPQIVLLDVTRDPLDFVYRIIGDRALANFTKNYTGQVLSTIPGKGPGSNVFATLEAVIASKAPRIQGVPYVGPNKDFISIESLALPLASDHETVDKIMIVVEFICVS